MDRTQLITALDALITALLADDTTPQGTAFGAQWAQIKEEHAQRRAEAEAKPAPFGRDPDGRAKPAPAMAGCSSMWNAAQQVADASKTSGRLFWIFDYVPGVQFSGEAPRVPPYADDPQKMEDDIRALAETPWGRYWLSAPENVATLDKEYALRFTGAYYVRRGDGTLERRTA